MDATLGVLAGLAVLDVVVHRVPRRAYLPACLLGTVVLLVWGRALDLSWADLGVGSPLAGLLWGLAAALLVAGVVAVGARWRVTRRWFGDARAATLSPRGLAWEAGVRLPLGTVLHEETAFRGLLLGVSVVTWSDLTGLVVSSVAFGLWHVVPSLGRGAEVTATAEALGERADLGFVVVAVVATTVAGFALGALRLVSGSLLAPMLLHWSLNGSGLLAGAAVARVGERRTG